MPIHGCCSGHGLQLHDAADLLGRPLTRGCPNYYLRPVRNAMASLADMHLS